MYFLYYDLAYIYTNITKTFHKTIHILTICDTLSFFLFYSLDSVWERCSQPTRFYSHQSEKRSCFVLWAAAIMAVRGLRCSMRWWGAPRPGLFLTRSKSRAQFPASPFRKFAAEDEAEALAGTVHPDGSEMDYKEPGMMSVGFSWTDLLQAHQDAQTLNTAPYKSPNNPGWKESSEKEKARDLPWTLASNTGENQTSAHGHLPTLPHLFLAAF